MDRRTRCQAELQFPSFRDGPTLSQSLFINVLLRLIGPRELYSKWDPLTTLVGCHGYEMMVIRPIPEPVLNSRDEYSVLGRAVILQSRASVLRTIKPCQTPAQIFNPPFGRAATHWTS